MFSSAAGCRRVDRHPRFLADLRGPGRADIVGFGEGVMIDPRNGDGTYPVLPLFVIPNFGYRDSGPVEQQGHAISLQFQCASPRHTLIIYLANHGGARL